MHKDNKNYLIVSPKDLKLNEYKTHSMQNTFFISLKDGKSSVNVPIKFKDNKVNELISIPYEYNSIDNTIKLFEHNCFMRDARKAFSLSGETTNISEVVDDINKLIIQAATESGITALLRTNPPNIPPEDSENFYLVYTNDGFLECYNPEKKYDDSHIILPCTSTWGGIVYFQNGECFANVIGSTGDPKVGSSWLTLWEENCNGGRQATTCTSLNFPLVCNVPDRSYIVGGHVISGQRASYVARGSSVYIMPICKTHNSNDNVYMQALQYTVGVWLINYHNP